MKLFVNKAWPYGEPNPDHEFLALNSRMSELQGAVAVAQMAKLDACVDRRIAAAADLTARLGALEGISCPGPVGPRDVHTFWKYAVTIDPDVIEGGPTAVAAQLRHYDVASVPRYIAKPAFACRVIADQRTFGSSRFPFSLARPDAVDYAADKFKGTYEVLDTILVLPINERYRPHHVEYLADSIARAVRS